jgi:hypothetical protein
VWRESQKGLQAEGYELIGAAISLAVCTEGQVPPTEHLIVYHANPVIVRKVQIALRNRGYYHDLVDGYLGEGTGIAMQMFQIDHCKM